MKGFYPPPEGESEVPGLELAGEVRELGEGVDGWAVGDRVMALTAGGAHAELAAVPAGQLMPLPEGWSFVDGAAMPEAGLTAWVNLVTEGRLAAGETVVVTGATGGMGRTFVQLAQEIGAQVIAAGREMERLKELRELGADVLVELGEGFVDGVKAATEGEGADLGIELVGGEHLARTLAALRFGGRCVLVGLLAGRSAKLDLGIVLGRRLRLIGSTLRSRSREEKAGLVEEFWEFAGVRCRDGSLRPQLDRVFGFGEIGEAYAALEAGGGAGKIVVEM